MNSLIPTVKQLIELAKESGSAAEIDWSQHAVTEEQAYQMMASQILEDVTSLPESHQLTVCMATITKLLVENFVLNLALSEKNK